ncbi:hypothetical protein AGMMS50289_21370 [Betaproteobacteria bacterium]|nr:hypothetical protein AGMMS50289_21370 [Betaproteobacteria bacterium]
MIRSLWIARTGLDAQQTNIDVIANNLANVSTGGFKKSRAVFQDLLYQVIRQPGAQSTQQTQISNGLQLGTGVNTVSTARIHTQGNLQFTENALDVAINGAGFLQILLPDGTTAYTRDGAFQKDNQGNIVTPDGYPLQPNINIPEDALSITIGKDGTVSITQAGEEAYTRAGSLEVNVNGVLQTKSGYILQGDGGPVAADGDVVVGRDGDGAAVALQDVAGLGLQDAVYIDFQ